MLSIPAFFMVNIVKGSSLSRQSAPVNGKDNKHQGGEDVSTSPHHHQSLAHEIPRIPLKIHIISRLR